MVETVEKVEGVEGEMDVMGLPQAEPAPVALTPELLMALLKQQGDTQREALLAAVEALKAPSAAEAAKLQAEHEQRLALAARKVEAAQREALEIAERQTTCGHIMPNGQTNFRGQVNSNGWASVFCSHCQLMLTFEATELEKNQAGLNVSGWGPGAFGYITRRVRESAGKVPPPVPRAPLGATITFEQPD